METTSVTEAVGATLTSIASPHPQLSPEDIKRYLVGLRTDTVLKAAMGGTTTDPRIYSYYQPAALIDATHPAYITYALTALPEATQATEDPVFTLAVWALNIEAMQPVRDRLVTLLNERPLTMPSGRTVWGTKISERDSYQENTKFTGRQLVFRLGVSKV